MKRTASKRAGERGCKRWRAAEQEKVRAAWPAELRELRAVELAQIEPAHLPRRRTAKAA